jgi:hypothetical protein
MILATLTLDALTIHDEESFEHVAIYGDLKAALQASGYTFRVLPDGEPPRHDHALLLNLTFWQPDAGGDILPSADLEADVVAHVAWHHLANRAFCRTADQRASADALFLGESIASAFDVYLVGRLLGHAPNSSFLESQVPAMADATSAAGLSEDDFETMLGELAANPEAAFAELRALLMDTTRALFDARDAAGAHEVLVKAQARRFGSLLHRYELSNWVLFAKAYASAAPDAAVRAFDATLRDEAAIETLCKEWLGPA